MPLFRINNGNFKKLTANLAGKEKDLQKLIETNLLEALDTHFLVSEYPTTSGGRIDTLGVDHTGAPTIIEYKRNKNDNVINQALSYLNWLKSQKPGFFEMLMQENLPKNVVKGIVLDWNNPRVVCIAAEFNRFDIEAVNVLPIRIELMSYQFFEGDIFNLTYKSSIVGKQQLEQPIKKVSLDGDGVQSGVELLRAKVSHEIKMLFDDVRAHILALGAEVVERVTSAYIAYRVSKNFVELHLQKSQIRITLRPINYDDPEGRIKRAPKSFGWTMDRQILMKNAADFAYVKPMIERSYRDVI